HAAEKHARLCSTRFVHARHLGATCTLVQGRLRFRRYQELRHVQRAYLVMRFPISRLRTAAPVRQGTRLAAMTQMLLRSALCALLFTLASCAAPARKTPHGYAPLILISIDGYRADYFERGLSPNLAALAASGVHAQSMRSAFPTLTFPNHYT